MYFMQSIADNIIDNSGLMGIEQFINEEDIITYLLCIISHEVYHLSTHKILCKYLNFIMLTISIILHSSPTLLPNFIQSQDSRHKHVVENIVDPDQLASQKPADLDLHCFRNRRYPALAWERGNDRKMIHFMGATPRRDQ